MSQAKPGGTVSDSASATDTPVPAPPETGLVATGEVETPKIPTLAAPTVLNVNGIVLTAWTHTPDKGNPRNIVRLGKVGVPGALIEKALDLRSMEGLFALTDGNDAVLARIRDHERNGEAMRYIGGQLRAANLMGDKAKKATLALPNFQRQNVKL